MIKSRTVGRFQILGGHAPSKVQIMTMKLVGTYTKSSKYWVGTHRTVCLFGMCILRTRQTLKTRQNFKKVPQKKIKNNDTSETFNSTFFLFWMRMDKNRALNENLCSILFFFMNTIKSLSPFTDQEYAHRCNILYCLVCLVLKMQMSVLCGLFELVCSSWARPFRGI